MSNEQHAIPNVDLTQHRPGVRSESRPPPGEGPGRACAGCCGRPDEQPTRGAEGRPLGAARDHRVDYMNRRVSDRSIGCPK
jgi:hypothetical protein